MSDRDAQAAGERVEALLAELRAEAGPQLAATAEELVSCLVELYGAGLARIVAILGEDEAVEGHQGAQGHRGAQGHQGAGPRLMDKLVADPLVESLLVLHGLHPLDTSARVRRAVEQVLPQLGAHAGDVEYLGLDEAGVLRLRLEQRGCSAATVRDLIAKAVAAAAPEAAGVGIEVVEPGPALLQITPRPAGIRANR
jgi:Fe-S cluster biogenesis protein NfuA